MKHSPIQSANLGFNEEGTPVSREFDDVYFSNDNGLEETRYVFLGGNRLSERFATHDRSLFIVGESGFGTGLNFLALFMVCFLTILPKTAEFYPTAPALY